MTNEKTGQNNEHEEKCATKGCCSSKKLAEMMAKCGEDMQCEFVDKLKEMMEGGCCQPKQR